MREIWTREDVLRLVNEGNKEKFEELDKSSSFWDEAYNCISDWVPEQGSLIRKFIDENRDWMRYEVIDVRSLFWDRSHDYCASTEEYIKLEAEIEEEGYTHYKMDW